MRKISENLRKEIVEEGYVTSHRLKWGPLPPNEIVRISELVREEEGRKEEKDGVSVKNLKIKMLITIMHLLDPMTIQRYNALDLY